MEKEYLSVSEYSKIKGVSYQATYKKLNGTLKPYVEVVNGRKMLKKSILNDPFLTPTSTLILNVNERSLNEFERSEPQVSQRRDVGSPSASTQTEIERINRRNEEIIDDLRQQIKDKDIQIAEMSSKIANLFETHQRLVENNQTLQLRYQMLIEEKENKKDINLNAETVEDNVDEVEEVDNSGAPTPEENKPEKKGFFQRLFGL